MENTATAEGRMPSEYDYRLYDQIWQRVSPELNPYPEVRPGGAPAGAAPPAPAAPAAAAPAARQEPDASLPGAEENPCCMGSAAQTDIAVVTGFIEEEAAGWRCCMRLGQRASRQEAGRLFRRIAEEKREAVRSLAAAHYLITGTCYQPAVSVAPMRWENICQALRACYHQEACSGLNYQRAADATGDLCLQELFNRLGEQSYRRARAVLEVLGRLVT